MLHGPLAHNGYDWWWHSFTAVNEETGEEEPFFIEFFTCNPALAENEPVFGQLPENIAAGKKPSYLMVKAGNPDFNYGEFAIIRNQSGLNSFKISVSKLGYVKAKISMPVDGKINNVTIKQTPSGKYFCVLNVEVPDVFYSNDGCIVGLDVGIKTFYTDSNNNSISNPKTLAKTEKKLIKEQRRLSRMVKGSANWNKQRIKVARIHEKITNQRNDFLHKESTKLVKENQIICIEDLDVKGMVRNHKLAKSISDVSWSKFFDMLEYKSAFYGTEIIKVPRFYPSSQTCGCCGYKNPNIKNLSIREWACPVCGTYHDRDGNAAKNILKMGLSLRMTA